MQEHIVHVRCELLNVQIFNLCIHSNIAMVITLSVHIFVFFRFVLLCGKVIK